MVTLPASGPKPLYYSTFVGYFKGILEYLSIPFQMDGEAKSCYFVVKLGKEEVVFNFSDFYETPEVDKYKNYFKYHYSKQAHGKYKNVYPFSPVSFCDWNEYFQLRDAISYTGKGDLIVSLQRPYGGAKERRKFVQEKLKQVYKSCLVGSTINQVEYWKLINRSLVHVFVPGARNDILDRACLQYLAFGCCTISPRIADTLPYDQELKPGIHYVECSDDYSDLTDKIEWCRSNRSVCVEIGKNAKRLFEAACLPDKLWTWILEKVQCDLAS